MMIYPIAFDTGNMKTTPEMVRAVKEARATNATNGVEDVMLRRSADLASMVDYWDTTDAIVEGVGAMKAAREQFMPKFEDEEQTEYNNRLKCVKMTNVYLDGVEGLASKPFEQEVTLGEDDGKSVPSEFTDFIEDVDGSGNNLTIFASQVFFHGINSAIHWIFVDHPPADPNIRTVADAKASGARPYWSHVLGRNILYVTGKVINGNDTLTFIRVFEPGTPNKIREFKRNDDLTITWELYEWRNDWREFEDGTKTQYYSIDTGALTIDQIPFVPFITGRRDGRSFKINPPMRPAADLQVNLYQNESALEWNKRAGAYAMLTGVGVRPDKDESGKIKPVRVGPNRVLYAPMDGSGKAGEWKYIQPDAQVMEFLAGDIKETIAQLRELARQPLTAQMGITVITSAFAAGKAKSAVGAWALGLKDALENAMVITAKFKNINTDTYDPVVKVFTEFDEFTEGKDLDALGTAVATNKISDETYRYELKRRRVLSDEFDEEQERERLLEQVPSDNGLDTGALNDVPPKVKNNGTY